MIQRWRQGLLRISLLLYVFQDPSGIHPAFFGAVPDMGLEPCIFCRIRRMCLGQLSFGIPCSKLSPDSFVHVAWLEISDPSVGFCWSNHLSWHIVFPLQGKCIVYMYDCTYSVQWLLWILI